jgi:hypothetical protein
MRQLERIKIVTVKDGKKKKHTLRDLGVEGKMILKSLKF